MPTNDSTLREIVSTLPGAATLLNRHGIHLAIRALQDLTHGFKAPRDGCRTWAALYAGLEALTNELLRHIHIENDLLSPRLAAEGCLP